MGMGALRFTDQVVVVTGGTSGIGLACARRLLDEGANVVIAGRSTERGAGALSELDSDHLLFAPADVSNRDDVDRLVAMAVAAFGRIDSVVNAAGSVVVSPFESVTVRHWQRTIDSNLTAVFHVCQSALPALRASREQQHGLSVSSIVNVASLNAHTGDAGMVSYSAAKAGVLNFTRSLAIELGPVGIRVNAVSPGAIDTPMTLAVTSSPGAADAYRLAIPLRRFGQPDEIAAAVAFVASRDASFMTGGNLIVDGGVTAGSGHPNPLSALGEQ